MDEQWVPGVFIDETWRFSPEQARAIEASSGLSPQSFERVLAELTGIAQDHRAFVQNECSRPAPKASRPQLDKVAAAAEALSEAIRALDASAREHLEDPMDDPLCLDLRRFEEQVSAWGARAGAFDGRGRPREEALGILVNRLALLWESGHGKWPTRSVDYLTGSERGGFGQFVQAVLAAVDPGRARPDGIIRQVLQGRRHMEKNRSPSSPL
jgi:hypothetical protein